MEDFNASVDNKFIDYIVELFQDENLCFFDHVTLDANTYTYKNTSRGTRPWIDHIILNYNLLNKISGCGLCMITYLETTLHFLLNYSGLLSVTTR